MPPDDATPSAASAGSLAWIPVSTAAPTVEPQGLTATVLVAHVVYDHVWGGDSLRRVRTNRLGVEPASYLGTDRGGAFFKSMVNGRRLEAKAWMPLPAPPTDAK